MSATAWTLQETSFCEGVSQTVVRAELMLGGICSGRVVGCESRGRVLGWRARKWEGLTGDTHGGQAKWLSG